MLRALDHTSVDLTTITMAVALREDSSRQAAFRVCLLTPEGVGDDLAMRLLLGGQRTCADDEHVLGHGRE